MLISQAGGERDRMTNALYYGDNLDVLRRYVADESVDLVYLDPPFKSDQNYNVLFQEQDGSRSAAQIQAFADTWRWDLAAEAAFQEVVEAGGQVSLAMQAFRTVLGESDMLAYLSMMGPRLKELHRVLKPTGSIYLHCDPTASHYLKVLMDSIFAPGDFVNEVVWQRTSAHNDPSRYGRVHDLILFYAKGEDRFWNQQFDAPDEGYFSAHDFEKDETGRLYRKRDLTAPAHGRDSGQYEWKGKLPSKGRMWSYTQENMERLEQEGRIVYTSTGMPRLKIYHDDLKGVPYQDVWANPELWLNSAAKERLGYPTQKPEALLERIIKSSSTEGQVVLDPFCGCRTAIVVAQRLNRQWIGIDVTHLAIALMKHRLQQAFGDTIKDCYTVIGEPTDVAGAQALAQDNPYQFQWWALGLVNARPVEQKKGADKGIDGRLFFHDEPTGGKTKQIIFSVKAGKLHAPYVRDLRGVVDREKAAIGVLIAMEEPTQPMRTEAASAGFYESGWGVGGAGTKHPKIQIITVGELLDGKRIDAPPMQDVRTFKKAPRVKGKSGHKQGAMFDE